MDEKAIEELLNQLEENEHRNSELIRQLEDVRKLKEKYGRPLLLLAAGAGHIHLFKYLTRTLEDINPPDEMDCTPLHAASAQDRSEIVEYILPKIHNKNPPDKNYITPLHNAANGGALNVIKILLPFCLDKNPKAGPIDSKDSVTPLHSAALEGHLHVVKYLCRHIEGDINPKLLGGNTPLNIAAGNGHLNVVSFYTNQLSDPNPAEVSDNIATNGRTPLHDACEAGYLPVVEHIAGLLVDKNPKDSNDNTPLHLASQNGHLDIVKYLAQRVENIHPQNGIYWGQMTPLDYAIENGHTEIVNFFQQLQKSKQRKTAKSTRANKHVKISTVTQGNAEDYDIDSVLQSLGISDETDKQKTPKKSKKKFRKPRGSQDAPLQNQTASGPLDTATHVDHMPTEAAEYTLGADSIVDSAHVEETLGAAALVNPQQDQDEVSYETSNPSDCAAMPAHLKVFECPVCLELMKAPKKIFGCSNDHYICSECLESSDIVRCPICREDFDDVKPKRRFQSEQLLAMLIMQSFQE